METFNHLENKIPSNKSNQGSQYFRTTNGILSASDNLSAIKSSHTTLPNILGIIEITSNFRLFQKGKQRERDRESKRETERDRESYQSSQIFSSQIRILQIVPNENS